MLKNLHLLLRAQFRARRLPLLIITYPRVRERTLSKLIMKGRCRRISYLRCLWTICSKRGSSLDQSRLHSSTFSTTASPSVRVSWQSQCQCCLDTRSRQASFIVCVTPSSAFSRDFRVEDRHCPLLWPVLTLSTLCGSKRRKLSDRLGNSMLSSKTSSTNLMKCILMLILILLLKLLLKYLLTQEMFKYPRLLRW